MGISSVRGFFQSFSGQGILARLSCALALSATPIALSQGNSPAATTPAYLKGQTLIGSFPGQHGGVLDTTGDRPTPLTKPYLDVSANEVDKGASVELIPRFTGEGVTGELWVVGTDSSKIFSDVKSESAYTVIVAKKSAYKLVIKNSTGESLESDPVIVNVRDVSITVTTASTRRTAGVVASFSAQVKGTVDRRVVWSVTGGKKVTTSVPSSGQAATLTWYAEKPGRYVIMATSVADGNRAAKAQVEVVPPPTLTSFSATPTNDSVTLLATFADGQAVVQPGGFTLQSNTPLVVGRPANTTTYVLTVINSAATVRKAEALAVGRFDATLTPVVPAVNLNLFRCGSTATRLKDGRVVIVGGQDLAAGENGYLASAEIWDPAKGKSDVLPKAMPFASMFHITMPITTGPNSGQYLVMGGWNGSTYLKSACRFNPADGTFTPTANTMSSGRNHFQATLLQDGRILVSGGSNDLGLVASVEVYDPATDKFLAPINMSMPRAYHSAACLSDGRVLITGGWSKDKTGNDTATASAEIFDPKTNTLTPAKDMSVAREGHTATLLKDGRVLVVGGDDFINLNNSAEFYDPTKGTFTKLDAIMPEGRELHEAILTKDGCVLIVGGIVGASAAPTNTLLIFDPLNGNFNLAGTLSSTRYYPTVVQQDDGDICVLGGVSSGNNQAVERYRVVSGNRVQVAITPNEVSLPINGTQAFSAQVSGTPNSVVTWTASAGKIDPKTGAFTAPATNGDAVITATSVADPTKIGTAKVHVTNVSITSFQSNATQVFRGQLVSFMAVFTGDSATLSPGGIPLTTGVPVQVRLQETTTFTLTVTSGSYSMTKSLDIKVSADPVQIVSFTAPSLTINQGDSLPLSWTLSGLPQILTLNGKNVLGGDGATVTPSGRQNYTLMASNPFNNVQKTLNVVARGILPLAGNADGMGYFNDQKEQARFRTVYGIARRSDGVLYVQDYGSQIRKINLNNEVSDFAGDPSGNELGTMKDGPGLYARFYSAGGIVVDNDDNLYVADYLAIRKVDVFGNVTTLAGSTTPGLADGKGTAAQFKSLRSIVFDGVNALYVGDKFRIRKVTLDGVVTTVCGADLTMPNGEVVDGIGPAAHLGYTFGMAFGTDKMLYLTSYYQHVIRKLNVQTGEVVTVAGQLNTSGNVDDQGLKAKLYYPYAIVPVGNLLYFYDGSNTMLRSLDPNNSFAVASVTGKYRVRGNADGAKADARLYLRSYTVIPGTPGTVLVGQAESIREINVSTGEVRTLAGASSTSGMKDGVGQLARLNGPTYMSRDFYGNLYIADTGNHVIRKMDTSGQITTVAGKAETFGYVDGKGTDAQFYNPIATAVDLFGNVYVSDYGNRRIRKIATDGTVTTIAGDGSLGSADGPGATASFNGPNGMAVDFQGNVYVADMGNWIIRKISPDGVVSTLAGKAGVTGSADGVGALASFGAGSPSFFSLTGSLLGDMLYVGDGSSVRTVDTATGSVSTLIPAQKYFGLAYSLALNNSGKMLYVIDLGKDSLFKVDLSTGTAGTPVRVGGQDPWLMGYHEGALPGTLSNPKGAVVTDDEDVILLENNGLMKITAP